MGAGENQTEVTGAVWLETGREIAPGSPQPLLAKTCLHSPGVQALQGWDGHTKIVGF